MESNKYYLELKNRRLGSKQGLFDDGYFENEWFNNIIDFTNWAFKDVEEEVQKMLKGEDVPFPTTHTEVALQNKYGTFKNAYKQYKEDVLKRKQAVKVNLEF